MPLPLTEAQAECLRSILDYIATWGYAPTIRDLMEILDVASPNGVMSHLGPLEKKGYIRRDKRISRGIVILDKARDWAAGKLAPGAKEVAAMLGRARQTISDWTVTRIADSGKPSKPKRKPKVTEKIAAEDRPKVVEALDAGKTQQRVASELKVSQQLVSQIASQERRAAEVKEAREAPAAKREGNCGVICGDFRVGGLAIDEE